MISQKFIIEIYKKSPFIKSAIESFLLIFISYFPLKSLASEFLKDYYWIYAFSFFVNGYLTIYLSGGKKNFSEVFFQQIKIVLFLYFVILFSFIYFWNNFNIEILIFGICGFLSIFESTLLVKEEADKNINNVIKICLLSRIFTFIFLVLFYFLFGIDNLFSLVFVYFFKEIFNFILFFKNYLNLIYRVLKSRIKFNFHDSFINKYGLLITITSSIDVILRYMIGFLYIDSAIAVFEYLLRITRFFAAIFSQLNRWILFDNKEDLFFGKYDKSLIIGILFLGLLSIILNFIFQSLFLYYIFLIAISFNFLFAVKAYIYLVKNDYIYQLISIYFAQIVFTYFYLKNYAGFMVIEILVYSISLFAIFMNYYAKKLFTNK